jgi:hypothetical protein
MARHTTILRSCCTAALALTLAACAGSSDDAARSPSASINPEPAAESSTTTTQALTPEQEVEAAYLKSWDVYAKAMRSLDDSHLEEVYTDDALSLRRDEIGRLRAANTPARMKVEHNYSVQVLEEGRAVVVDAYRNHSVLLDAMTGEPAEPDPNEIVQRKYDFVKEGGRWLIAYVTSLS